MSYSPGKLVEQMEDLFTLWVEDLNQKNVIICDKAKSIFDELIEKKDDHKTIVEVKSHIISNSVKITVEL